MPVATLSGVSKTRVEAFSDGVIAIVITVMVLELRPPHGTDLAALRPLLPVFLAYVLSFVNLGIYWNNHHHMLRAAERVDGAVLWANLHLLFWLSLFPFTTAWLGQNHASAVPAAAYGVVAFFAAVAYWLLQGRLIALEGRRSTLALAVGSDLKGRLSPVCYAAGVGLAFVQPWLSVAVYAGVALLWLVPDRRVERQLARGAR